HAEHGMRVRSRLLTWPCGPRSVFDEASDGLCEGRRVSGGHDQAVDLIVYVLWIASDRCRDHRERGRHGFHETVRAGFTERREHEDVQIPQRDLRDLSGPRKLYRCREVQRDYETLQFVAHRSLAPDDETNLRPSVSDHGHRMKQLDQTFLRPEIAQRSYHEP